VDEDEECKLALRGERGLGFVEKEEPVALELIFEQREEGFAVGAGVQALAAIAGKNGRAETLLVQLVDMCGSVEEAFFRRKKPAPVRLSKERRRARIRASVE
jgi:hypothetical protein